MSILRCEQLVKHYGEVRALDGVSLAIDANDSVAIVGESGCGKTTLAKLLVGLIKPDAGRVDVRREDIQMVFQDPYSSLDPLYCIKDILKESFWRRRDITPKAQEEQMVLMLQAVGLPGNILKRFPHEFSGGERQRIAIARTLLANPKILILDEAVSSLDVLVQKQIIDLLIQLKKEFNLTYIFISHNLRVVKRFSDKIIVMQQGKIIETVSNQTMFSQAIHPYTQQLVKAAFEYKN